MRTREHVVNVAVDLERLPSGWRWGTVQEVGAKREQSVLTGPFGTNMGRGDFIRDGVPVITISCLTDQGIRTEKAFFVSAAKAEELSRYRLKAGDLLFSRMASVGRAGIVGANLEGALFNYHLMRLRLDQTKLLPKFFTNYVRGSRQVRDYLLAVNHGATRDGINTAQLLSLPVLLPPLDEQRLIVEEIEKQFTRLDAGVAALGRVQANLKRYRAAVLKAACEGRLVPIEAELAHREGRSYETGDDLLSGLLAERRACSNGRRPYKEPSRPDLNALPQLPDGWAWSRLEQLGTVYGGLTKNPRRAKLAREIPYLRVANVYANELRLDDIESIGVEDSELPKLLVKAGDLLVVEGNGSRQQIGRLAIWDGSIEPCVHQNHLIKVRLLEPLLGKWILYWLLSAAGRDFVEVVASSTSGLYTLSVNKVGDLPIPVPPLLEQKRVVEEIERRFSVADELKAGAAANLQRATRLRRSVLQRAFSGTLVSLRRDLSCQSAVLRRSDAEGLQ